MTLGKPDAVRTTYYSWAECDGDMYMSQNHCDGLYNLMTLLKQNAPDGRANQICVNHWRNAESATSIRYFADCSVNAAMTPKEFYLKTAAYYGYADPELYAQAEVALSETFTGCTGFCYVGCWFTAPEENARPGAMYEEAHLLKAIDSYRKPLELYRKLYDLSDENSKRHLRLMINRLEASILHHECFLALSPICVLTASDQKLEDLSAETRREIGACADRAMVYAKKYLFKYSEIIADRGAEGQLSSYYKTMVYYLDHIKRKYLGIPLPELYESIPLDPPPAPGER